MPPLSDNAAAAIGVGGGNLDSMVPSVTDVKQASVIQATTQKQAAVGGMPTAADLQNFAVHSSNPRFANRALPAQSQMEADLATLNQAQLIQKYGSDTAMQLLGRGLNAQADYQNRTTPHRDILGQVVDPVVDVGSGLVNAIGSIPVLGAGMLDGGLDAAGLPTTGLGVGGAHLLDSLNSWTQDHLQSRALNIQRGQNAKDNAYTAALNKAVQGEDKAKGDGDLVAGLKRIGRDTIDAVQNAGADPMVLESGVANAVGSVLAAGPVTKGVTAVGKAALGAKAAMLLEKAATPTAIGVMEGSGAYQGAVSQAKAAGATDEEANRAGLEAAAIQAPIAAATGTLVSKFEAHPFAKVGMKEALGNIGREALEEGLQSGAGQYAQNQGVKDQANPNQDLLDGVGQQAGEGALYGSLSAGAIEAPTLAGHTATGAANALLNAAKPVVSSLGSALDNRNAKVAADVAAQSPVAPEKVQAQQEAAVQATPDLAARTAEVQQAQAATGEVKPEEVARHTEATSKLFQSMMFDPAIEAKDAAPVVQQALDGVGDRFQAVRRVAEIAVAKDSSPEDKLAAGAFLTQQVTAHQAMFTNDLQDAIASVPQGSELRTDLEHYLDTVAKIFGHKHVQQAMQASVDAMSHDAVAEQLADGKIDTPEGQQTAQSVADLAASDISRVNPDTVDNIGQVLKHAAAGKIRLTPEQRAILQAAHDTVQANEARVKGYQAAGLDTPTDRVSYEIQNGQLGPIDAGTKTKPLKSATAHAQGVIQAYQDGDFKRAQLLLRDLGLFAQHMQNKLGALNAHYDQGAGPNVTYKALQPGRKLGSAQWGVGSQGLHPTNQGSVEYAQRVALDAKAVGEVYNGLVKALPKLNQGKVQFSPIQLGQLTVDPQLSKTAKQIVAEHQAQTETVNAEPESKGVVEPPAKPAERPVEKPAPQPEAKVEPKAEPKTEAKTEPKPAVRETAAEAVKEEPAPAQSTDKQSGSVEAPSSNETQQDAGPVETTEPVLIGSLSEALPEPVVPRSRLRTLGAKMGEAVRSAFASEQSFTAFMGKASDHELTPEILAAWQKYLGKLEPLQKSIAANLTKALDDKYGKGVLGEALAQGEQVHRGVQFKVLNVVRESLTPKGRKAYAYDPELLSAASLAGLQWLMAATQRQGRLDREDVGKILGVPEELVSAQAVFGFNRGVTLDEAKSLLSDTIVRFWGLKANPTAPQGFVQGIPDAMAAEVLRGLEKAGLIELTHIDAEGRTLTPAQVKAMHRANEQTFRQVRVPENDEVRQLLVDTAAYPMALEDLVLTDPERTRFIGKPPKAPSKTQARNRLVPLSQQQMAAERAVENIPRQINQPFVDFLAGLGKDLVLELFGVGKIDEAREKLINQNDLESLKGQNQSVLGAFHAVQGMVAEVKSIAAKAGQDLTEMPIYEDYGYSSVNRLHAQGGYNTQNSKLVRHSYLPGWATLDLSGENVAHTNAFMLGLAQALGMKIQEKPISESVDEVTDLVDGDLKPAVDLLKTWLTEGHELSAKHVEELKSTLAANGLDGSDLPLAIHGLMELARYQNTAKEDLSSFKTAMYVEADGIADGPTHALVHYSNGSFTPEFLEILAKGGVFITHGEQTANDFFKNGAKDLYNEVTGHLNTLMNNQRQGWLAAKNYKAVDQHDRLMFVLQSLGLNVGVDAAGNVTLTRKTVKNPLTISIYGSGAKGIAGKITAEIVEAIYAQKTALLQAQAVESQAEEHPGVLLFGSESVSREAAIQRYELQEQALVDLFCGVLTVPKSGKAPFIQDLTAKTKAPQDPDNLQTFTLHPSAISHLQDNVLKIYVEPMRQAIQDKVLGQVKSATDGIQSATQIMSIFGRRAHEQAYRAAVEAKKKADPTWNESIGFSQKELEQIEKSVGHLGAWIKMANQTFMVGGSDRAIKGVQYSRSLDDDLRTDANIAGPGEAGVRGVPYLTIGPGDGQAIQNLATLKGGPSNYSPVFDGVNFALDTLMDDTRSVNQAVYQALMANPFASVVKAYQEFLQDKNFDSLTTEDWMDLHRGLSSPEDHRKLKAAYTEAVKAKKDFEIPSEILARLKSMIEAKGSVLEHLGEEIQARHDVLAQIDMSVDHMAGPGAPHVVAGKVSLEGLTQAQILQTLNDLYQARLKEIRQEKVERQTDDNISKELKAASVLERSANGRSTGARIISDQALRTLAPQLKIPAEHKVLLAQTLKALAGDGYSVVLGTPKALLAHAKRNGKTLTEADLTEAKGLIVPQNRTIYLVEGSSETLVHELIHAATLDKVLAFYDDDLQLPRQEAEAVQRLDAMMHEWLEMGDNLTGMSPEQAQAFQDAMNAVNEYLDQLPLLNPADQKKAKALALNEFMAWNLANQDLVRVLRRTEIKNPLARVIHDMLRVMRDLFFGTNSPQVPKDFYSNLRFNTDVLLASPSDQKSLQDRYADVALYHTRSYGTDQRLIELQKTFRDKVVNQLQQAPRLNKGNPDPAAATITAKADVEGKISRAVVNGLAVAKTFQSHGFFDMTMQEKSTFTALVTAFATEAQMDPNALARIQELYTHVTKQLTVEDFMHDAASLDPAARYYAEQKYKAIVGNLGVETDALGRSSLLPAFFALANTNDEFRQVLAGMELPKTALKDWKSVDHWVDNLGHAGLENLSKLVSGENRNSKDVLEAIDSLTKRVAEISDEATDFVSQTVNPVWGGLNRANDKVVELMQQGTEAAITAIEGAKAHPKLQNKFVQGGLEVTQALVSVLNEKAAPQVAEGLVSALNTLKVPPMLRALTNDFLGRMQSNATIFDMIKATRTRVAQIRQAFRENVPGYIAAEFSRKLSQAEWTHLYHGLARTDFLALKDGRSVKQLTQLLADPSKVKDELSSLMAQLKGLEPKRAGQMETKMQELAHYMVSQETTSGNFLKNAYMIARLAGEPGALVATKEPSAVLVKTIDQAVTLMALQAQPQERLDVLKDLATTESQGLEYLSAYLQGQRKDELSKVEASGAALRNHYKGFALTEPAQGSRLIVASDLDHDSLIFQGFERVGDYVGSKAEIRSESYGYYFSPVSGKATFGQGILQTVRKTASGVDPATGFSFGTMTAGLVSYPKTVKRIAARGGLELAGPGEHLMPVYDENFEVSAYERAVNPVQAARLNPNTHLAQVVGQWRGRQVEEVEAQSINEGLIDALHQIWVDGVKASQQDQFVNLSDPKDAVKQDRVIQDALKLIPPQTLAYIEQVYGADGFRVRKSDLLDVLGERNATVGDFWTGTTRWSPAVQTQVRNLATAAFGKNAFKYLTIGEKALQNIMADARQTILVRSVVVPVANFMSGLLQLLSRGVTPQRIAGVGKKIAEVRSYLEHRKREIKLEADLRAAEAVNDLRRVNTARAELQTISDANKRLSIWPLIEGNEFTAISEPGHLDHKEANLYQGEVVQFMEHKLEQTLDRIGAKDLGRYALMTHDTALFQGMQAAMNYGDFLMKAVLFDHYTQDKGISNQDALAKITEEFGHSDRLPGRVRGTLESDGLLWFYNFKLRITKSAVSTLRENPLHALLAAAIPAPPLVGTVGTPLNSNVLSMIFGGNLHWSLGMGMGLNAHSLLPSVKGIEGLLGG